MPSAEDQVQQAATIHECASLSKRQFPKVACGKAMPEVDNGIPAFRPEVAWILRLRASRTAAELQHHVVNRVRPRVTDKRTYPFAETLIDGELSSVVTA